MRTPTRGLAPCPFRPSAGSWLQNGQRLMTASIGPPYLGDWAGLAALGRHYSLRQWRERAGGPVMSDQDQPPHGHDFHGPPAPPTRYPARWIVPGSAGKGFNRG
jgi:hypothetical protein